MTLIMPDGIPSKLEAVRTVITHMRVQVPRADQVLAVSQAFMARGWSITPPFRLAPEMPETPQNPLMMDCFRAETTPVDLSFAPVGPVT